MQQTKQHIIFTKQASSKGQHQEAMSHQSEQHQAEMFSGSFSFISF